MTAVADATVKAIDITVRRHRIEHSPGIDMIREWQLNENAINRPVFILSDGFDGRYKLSRCS